MKDHGRDPDKFVRELMGMNSRTAGPDEPANGFDFSKYTDGKISAASGIGDRKDSYQTTVPVQHGHSGGALVDAATGWVVGVVNARLEDARGSADNVSYSIKGKIMDSRTGAKRRWPEAIMEDRNNGPSH